jgi:hypothetical protein
MTQVSDVAHGLLVSLLGQKVTNFPFYLKTMKENDKL